MILLWGMNRIPHQIYGVSDLFCSQGEKHPLTQVSIATEGRGGSCVNAGDIFTSPVSGRHCLNCFSYLTCLNSKPLVYHPGPELDHGFTTQKSYQCQRVFSFCETGQAGVRQGKTSLLKITSIWFASSVPSLLIIFWIYKTRFMIQPTTPETEIELLENFPHRNGEMEKSIAPQK